MRGMFHLLLAGIAAFLLNLAAQAQPQAQLSTAPVERDALQESLRLDGVIEAVQRSTVSAQTSGTVMRLPFDVDDRVTAGELIMQLEDSEQRARRGPGAAGIYSRARSL